VSDDHYSKDSGILQEQDKYATTNLVDGGIIAFTNMQDRGFRTIYAAWNVGKQTVIQPPFARSDKRFTGRQTVYSGLIAHDRSGNERGVNVSERKLYVQISVINTINNQSPLSSNMHIYIYSGFIIE